MQHSSADALGNLVGARLDDRYIIARRLAKTDEMAVFAGVDASSGLPVTLEVVMPPGMRQVQPGLSSVSLLGEISDPGLLEVLDIGATPEGLRYAAMEAVDGETLSMRLTRRGRLTPIEATEIALGIAAVLDSIHAAGTVHGNLHPARVFVAERNGRRSVKLSLGLRWPRPLGLDERSAQLIGRHRTIALNKVVRALSTPLPYCPPEHLLGQPLDERADVYAVGALLYEMLRGHPPHFAASAGALAAARLTFAPHPLGLDVPTAVRNEIERALARSPAERHPSARALTMALARAVASMSLHPTVEPGARTSRPPPPMREQRTSRPPPLQRRSPPPPPPQRTSHPPPPSVCTPQRPARKPPPPPPRRRAAVVPEAALETILPPPHIPTARTPSLSIPIYIEEPPDPRDTERPFVRDTLDIDWHPEPRSRAGSFAAAFAVLASLGLLGFVAWSGSAQQAVRAVTGTTAPAAAQAPSVDPAPETTENATAVQTPAEPAETVRPQIVVPPPRAQPTFAFQKPTKHKRSRDDAAGINRYQDSQAASEPAAAPDPAATFVPSSAFEPPTPRYEPDAP